MRDSNVLLSKSKLPIHFLAVGFIMLLAGIAFLIKFEIQALLILPGLLITFIRSELILDMQNNLLIDSYYIFDFLIYKNKSVVNKPSYIILLPVKLHQRQSVVTITREARVTKYRLNFAYPAKKYKTIHTGEKFKIEEISRTCSAYYNVEVKCL
ncbi:MAG: hypothetical protein U9N85_10170 [Bacteroidota bacterium]|nr:hypothetical protein [Bacteroidota bacterium]